MSARGLFDIPVNEDGWERKLPPSTVPWKTVSPPIQQRSSDSWKPMPSPPKTAEVPKPQAPLPNPKPEPDLSMPSFWKPSWDSDITEPPMPQVPPISRLVTVEDIPDEESVPEPVAPAQVPVPRNLKSTPVPAQQPISVKPQIPSVADEPTPIWGQPWRKGESCFLPTGDSRLTSQQESHQFLTHRRTRRRNPFMSLPRCPPLLKTPPRRHQSLLLLPSLPPYLPRLPHRHRPSPRQLNSFVQRGPVRAKTKLQRQRPRRTWRRNRKKFLHLRLRLSNPNPNPRLLGKLESMRLSTTW